MDYVIGCDVGSQSTKAVLLSFDGALLGEASADYAIDYPQPTWAEQPVERWTNALTGAVRRLLAETGALPEQVRGLGLASQVEGVVPLDAGGQPLRPASLWMDRRASAQCERVRQTLGPEAALDLTGLNLDPSHVLPRFVGSRITSRRSMSGQPAFSSRAVTWRSISPERKRWTIPTPPPFSCSTSAPEIGRRKCARSSGLTGICSRPFVRPRRLWEDSAGQSPPHSA